MRTSEQTDIIKMGMEQSTRTIADICRETGTDIDTMRRRWTRKFDAPFNRYTIPTDAQLAVLFADNRRLKGIDVELKPIKAQKDADNTTYSAPDNTPDIVRDKPEQETRTNQVWLWLPLFAASIACFRNMWLICLHLSGSDKLSALVLTLLFSGSAMCFILSRATGAAAQVVMWSLIAFECFCNTTGVYYGLLGKNGVPTPFLGVVTDIFNSGTHGTAISLGAIMALIIGAVQVVSIKTIIK